jgi:hypothetical protein
MKAIKTTLIAVMAIAMIAGCTKHETFVNLLFDCECGTITLNDRDLSIRLAEGYAPDSTNADLWRYHVVADFRTENEVANHIPNQDLAFTVQMNLTGSSTTANAVGALTVNELEAQVTDAFWDVVGGDVKVDRTDSLHTLTFLNVEAGGRTINAEVYIIPQ